MSKQKFIIVSNRLPVSVSRAKGKLEFTPSPGGLATAVSSLNIESSDMLWIGWPGISTDELRPGEKAVITRKLKSYGCFPVFMSKDQVKNFYEGYSNDTIWPMFHYFQSLAQFNPEYWQAYKEVNTLYKKAIQRQSDDQSTIWVHDYHLMLLPKMLREALPGSSIGFFLHIPFPSFEIFRSLPNRREILEGLLGADLIGFHTYDYTRHFLSSVLRVLGHENQHGSIILPTRAVTADAFPIGIDYDKFKTAASSPKVLNELQVLDDHYKHQRIILSVDRLDYSKGILKRLEAFEQFLKENPKYHKKVVLVVVAVPSRTEVAAYKELREVIEQTVSRINGAYTTVDWTPISYQFKNLPFEQLIALYVKADVALVTPLRDGMNLVAKEFIAAKQNTHGVLILSEMTGAVDELPEALRINPNDSASIVEAIKKALRMPNKERIERLEFMQRRLSSYSVQRWGADFIEQLGRSKQLQARSHKKALSEAAKKELLSSYKQAGRKLIFLDYDGTLRELVSSPQPSRAAPSKNLIKLLKYLAAQPGTEVCIISGRQRDVMEKWFFGLDVSLAAEHGAWIRHRQEWSQAENSFHKYKKTLLPILKRYSERTPGSVVEEKDFALVWHYRNVAPELAFARKAGLTHELEQAIANTDIDIHEGRKIVEIKPHNINKGAAALELLAINPSDFILAVGDDYTDEAMFELLPEETYSIKVGLEETHARFQLGTVGDVCGLLELLIK